MSDPVPPRATMRGPSAGPSATRAIDEETRGLVDRLAQGQRPAAAAAPTQVRGTNDRRTPSRSSEEAPEMRMSVDEPQLDVVPALPEATAQDPIRATSTRDALAPEP